MWWVGVGFRREGRLHATNLALINCSLRSVESSRTATTSIYQLKFLTPRHLWLEFLGFLLKRVSFGRVSFSIPYQVNCHKNVF